MSQKTDAEIAIGTLMDLMERQQKQIAGLLNICETFKKQMYQHRSNCQARHNPMP